MTDDADRRRTLVLRLVLGSLCAYHLGIGLSGTFATDLTFRFGAVFYGLDVADAGPRVVYMLKALSMYAIFTGLLLAAALARPARHRAVIGAAALLLAMRAVTRVACFDTLHEAFGVSWGHNLFNVTLLALQAAALLALLPPEPAGAGEPVLRPTELAARASARLEAVSRRVRPVFVASRSGERPGRV